MPLRAFAFSDQSGGTWGAAWIPSEPDQAALLVPAGGSAGGPASLEGEEAGEPWRLSAGQTELTLEGLGDAVRGDVPGFDQLCQVTGVLAGESGPRNVQLVGWRSARPEPLTSGRLESIRQVAGWFEQAEGFALLSVRPSDGRGQERDQITAALFGPAGAKPVADPRLSTTYTGSDRPTRASVELWVDTEGEGETQYPRRAIGEAVAAPAHATAGALALEARPFRWYSGGQEGAGIYLIGRAE